jgi:FdhE protein
VKRNSHSRKARRERPTAGAGGRWAIPLRNALEDLERLKKTRPELDAPGKGLALVLDATFGRQGPAIITEFQVASGGPSLRIDAVPIEWDRCHPLLSELTPRFAEGPLADAALALARALQKAGSAPARSFEESIRRDPARFATLAQMTLFGAAERLEASAGELGLDRVFVESVVRVLLLPELAPLAERLCAGLSEGSWSHAACPLCGSAPALAESRGLQERRYLRCDRCAADWPWSRFRCPFCGETDHRKLRYEYAEGEQDRYRRAICDACGGRFKIVATLAPLSPPALLVAQLATIHLDLIDTRISSTI